MNIKRLKIQLVREQESYRSFHVVHTGVQDGPIRPKNEKIENVQINWAKISVRFKVRLKYLG
jgi:hypothetical protein